MSQVEGLPEGYYQAKITDWGVLATKDYKPRPFVQLFLLEPKIILEWRGSFNQGIARDIALQTLYTCGLEPEKLNLLAGGKPHAALEFDRIVQAHVKHEAGMNDPSKTYLTVKSIYPIKKSGPMMDPTDFARFINQEGLRGELLAIKQKMSGGPVPSSYHPIPNNQNGSNPIY